MRFGQIISGGGFKSGVQPSIKDNKIFSNHEQLFSIVYGVLTLGKCKYMTPEHTG